MSFALQNDCDYYTTYIFKILLHRQHFCDTITIYCVLGIINTHYGVVVIFDTTSGLMLTNAEYTGLNECFQPVEKTFNKGEIITIYSPENDSIGIIKSGLAYILTENNEEQRRISDYFKSGDFFGLSFLPVTEEKFFYMYAKTDCTVDFIKYRKLINCCEKHCQKHTVLLDKILTQMIKKQTTHVDILAQRTLRSKLITYFHYQKSEVGSSKFTLPLPYSDLADYLAVDRSAMMRELKKLTDENIIAVNKRMIEIKQ